MKYIETEFSKELSLLLNKYNKTFTSDKEGIYVMDTESKSLILLTEAETASEDYRPKLIFLINLI